MSPYARRRQAGPVYLASESILFYHEYLPRRAAFLAPAIFRGNSGKSARRIIRRPSFEKLPSFEQRRVVAEFPPGVRKFDRPAAAPHHPGAVVSVFPSHRPAEDVLALDPPLFPENPLFILPRSFYSAARKEI